MDILENLGEIKKSVYREIEAVENAENLEKIRITYLGRKGSLTQILHLLKDLPLEERRRFGPKAQSLKNELAILLNEKIKFLQTANCKTQTKKVDITKPGEKIKLGHLHPLTKISQEIKDIFMALNFSVVEGPEVETERYNFDALNIPADHPARDMWDTFWLRSRQKEQLTIDKKQLTKSQRLNVKGQKLLLRTHTSPVQIRYMESHQPSFQIIVPGTVYRYEATDATHSFQFQQLEGLMVGRSISFANFKYIIGIFLEKFFKRKIEFELRPTYFPFVEPGVEVYIKWKNRWLEVAGAGMVHPKIFEAVHYNPREWQGFAFGFGPDRLAMIKYNIPDIRFFYSGDLRFIEQF